MIRPRKVRRIRHAKARVHDLPPIGDTYEQLSPFPGGQPLTENEHKLAEDLHDWILGGQDGLVNVLGTVLGIAVVTTDKTIILVGGLAALAAEAVSIAAVAYTSAKASLSYYESERAEQQRLLEDDPELQFAVLVDAYKRKGLSHHDAHRIVTELTHTKEVWVEMLMEEHLHLFRPQNVRPLRSALIVGFAATMTGIVPMLPFFLLAGTQAMWTSVGISAIALFAGGAASAKLTIGDWRTRGLEMTMIGIIAALFGFGIGWLFTSGIVSLG